MYYNSIIETIGNTPLVKLNKVNAGVQGTILAKVEYFNPGNSMKDRIAVKMIEDAENETIRLTDWGELFLDYLQTERLTVYKDY